MLKTDYKILSYFARCKPQVWICSNHQIHQTTIASLYGQWDLSELVPWFSTYSLSSVLLPSIGISAGRLPVIWNPARMSAASFLSYRHLRPGLHSRMRWPDLFRCHSKSRWEVVAASERVKGTQIMEQMFYSKTTNVFADTLAVSVVFGVSKHPGES